MEIDKDDYCKIVELIEKQMGTYKRLLTSETRLQSDLGISGDDAFELLVEFSRHFNVDMSDFNFSEYFIPEGDTILPALLRFFTGKVNPQSKELTIGNLLEAIKLGKLV